MRKVQYIDKEEMELAKSLEAEEWVSDLTKKEKKQYEEYARNSLTKQKRINIRMTERDLKKIQAKAIEEGVPYQSLISMLIHKYNEGKVSVQEWHNKEPFGQSPKKQALADARVSRTKTAKDQLLLLSGIAQKLLNYNR